jgi:hypothetical protein
MAIEWNWNISNSEFNSVSSDLYLSPLKQLHQDVIYKVRKKSWSILRKIYMFAGEKIPDMNTKWIIIIKMLVKILMNADIINKKKEIIVYCQWIMLKIKLFSI